MSDIYGRDYTRITGSLNTYREFKYLSYMVDIRIRQLVSKLLGLNLTAVFIYLRYMDLEIDTKGWFGQSWSYKVHFGLW